MKKIDLGQMIQILANIGVIGGMLFLAYEIRQNTATLQSSSFEDYTHGTIEFLMELASNPDLNEVWRDYAEGDANLSDSDQARALFMVRAQWFRYQSAFAQWQRGAMHPSDWEVARKQMCRSPNDAQERMADAARLRQETWHLQTPYLTDAFVKFIEKCWAEQDVHGP